MTTAELVRFPEDRPGQCRLPISNHFPPNVRDALVAASRMPIDFDLYARVKAINQVVAKARATYPELFNHKELSL